MSLEVTINVPGLKELSEALMQLAVAMGGKSVQMDEAAVGQAVHEQQSTEEAPWGNASIPQQNTTGGRTNSFSTSTSISTVSAGTRSSTDI